MNPVPARSAELSEDELLAKRRRAYTELGLGLNLRLRDGPRETDALPSALLGAVPESGATDPTPFEEEALAQVSPGIARVARVSPDLSSLEALAAQVAQCQACGLCKTRTQTVFSAGNAKAPLVIVGEAPGAEEDRTGHAFVGPAGQLLDSMLASLGLDRAKDTYICNVLKCRPPQNRDPSAEEVARCEPFLQKQLALVQPKLILVVGRFAAQSLLRTDASIASLRGRLHSYPVAGHGIPVIVTYHPAYLLRNLADKAKAWADLCFLKSEMEKSKRLL
jgi:uracil-DNA glycosylase